MTQNLGGKPKGKDAIIATIDKIESSNPTLGAKWKTGSLRYWYTLLAHFTLAERGEDTEDLTNIGAEMDRLRTERHIQARRVT